MRRDVQDIFRLTPHEKQCMMFSATLSKEIRPVCRKFMQDVSIFVTSHFSQGSYCVDSELMDNKVHPKLEVFQF